MTKTEAIAKLNETTNNAIAEIARQRAEALLQIAQETQDAFWDALSDLEAELGVDVSGDIDLSLATIDWLLEHAED